MRRQPALLSTLFALTLVAQPPVPVQEPPKPEALPVAVPAAPPEAVPVPATPGTPDTKPAEPAKTAEPVPAAAPEPVPPAAATGILFFYRESRFVGMALRPSVFVDDVEVAYISSGSYLKVAVKPGDHSVYTDEKKDALTFPIEAGKTYYFRVSIRMGLLKGHGKVEPVDEETGLKEVTEWKSKLTYTEKILRPEMVVKD